MRNARRVIKKISHGCASNRRGSPKSFQTEKNMNTKLAVIIGTVAIIFISGVWFAFQLPQNVPPKTDTAYTGPAFIDLRVGTVLRESFDLRTNIPFTQKLAY